MRNYVEYTLFDAKAATGVSKVIPTDDFQHIIVSVATDGGGDAALTLKFQGAVTGDSPPDFSAAASVSNMWDYIAVKDYEDDSTVDGDTGFSVAGADDYRIFMVNVDAIKYFSARVTARSEGEVTVKVRCYSNQ